MYISYFVIGVLWLLFFFAEAGLVLGCFVAIIAHFPSKPKNPPSVSSSMERMAFLPGLRSFLKNYKAIILTLAYRYVNIKQRPFMFVPKVRYMSGRRCAKFWPSSTLLSTNHKTADQLKYKTYIVIGPKKSKQSYAGAMEQPKNWFRE